MKFIKKHKILLIVIAVCLILLILMFFGIKNAFFANASGSKYGNRLDGIENYPIDNKTIEEIKQMLSDIEFVNDVKYNLEGRRMDFVIDVNDDVDLITSRSLADKIVEKFSDEIKSFYDIQVYLTSKNEESELYPTIGYKHKKSAVFQWNVN